MGKDQIDTDAGSDHDKIFNTIRSILGIDEKRKLEMIHEGLDEDHDLLVLVVGEASRGDMECIRVFVNIAASAIYGRLLEYSLKEKNQDLENLQEKLVEAAHKAGMSDMASSSLHYFGNLLTSLNVELDVIRGSDFKDWPRSLRILFTKFKGFSDYFESG